MTDALPLAAAFAAAQPEAAARTLEDIAPEEVAALLATFDAASATPVLAAMAPAAAAGALQGLSIRRCVEFLRGLRAQTAGAILRAMDPERRDRVLAGMSKARRLQVGLALRQPRRTVAAWMESAALWAPLTATAGSVRERLAREHTVPVQLFVTDDDRRHVGLVDTATVLVAPAETSIESVYLPGGPVLRASLTVDEALQEEAWQNHDVLPVIDHAGLLVGTVRYAALRATLNAERDRDASGARKDIGTPMDIANMLYLGMAEAIDTTIARRTPSAAARREPES